MGSKQWQHRARKKMTRNSDAEKLDELQAHLDNLGFSVIREDSIHSIKFSTRNHIRNPDLKVKFGKFECYLELDGKVHGTLEMPTKNTVRRNLDYENIKHSYVILSEEDAKFFKLDFGDLAAYLILLEYTKHLARLEGNVAK